jgi:hypothetical protein
MAKTDSAPHPWNPQSFFAAIPSPRRRTTWGLWVDLTPNDYPPHDRVHRRRLVPVPGVTSLAALNDLVAMGDERDDYPHIEARRLTVAQHFAARTSSASYRLHGWPASNLI